MNQDRIGTTSPDRCSEDYRVCSWSDDDPRVSPSHRLPSAELRPPALGLLVREEIEEEDPIVHSSLSDAPG